MITRRTARPPRAPHHRLLRRAGSLATVMAIAALGLAAGLALGTPASAADSDVIAVQMPGETGFSHTASARLLDVDDLVPGGSVTGTMQVRDTSGHHPASGVTDTISLAIVNTHTSDQCPTVASCAGSGEALAQAMRFTVTADGTAVLTDGTLAELVSGITIGAGLHDGDTVPLTVTASLPWQTGDRVQYGRLSFDLQLVLASHPDQQGHSNNPGGGNDGGTGGGGSGPSGPPGISVKGEASSVAPAGNHHGGTASSGRGGDADTMVLGADDALSYTGAPIRMLTVTGAAVLLAGLSLLLASRRGRRSRR